MRRDELQGRESLHQVFDHSSKLNWVQSFGNSSGRDSHLNPYNKATLGRGSQSFSISLGDEERGYSRAEQRIILHLHSLTFFFSFLWLHLWHMEVPGLGVKSNLQLQAYTTATETLNQSHICDLSCSLQQLNPNPHGHSGRFLTY